MQASFPHKSDTTPTTALISRVTIKRARCHYYNWQQQAKLTPPRRARDRRSEAYRASVTRARAVKVSPAACPAVVNRFKTVQIDKHQRMMLRRFVLFAGAVEAVFQNCPAVGKMGEGVMRCAVAELA